MLQESEERVHRRAFRELGRFTPNWVTDTWSLPSGENKPIHPDNRTPEEKEASRIVKNIIKIQMDLTEDDHSLTTDV